MSGAFTVRRFTPVSGLCEWPDDCPPECSGEWTAVVKTVTRYHDGVEFTTPSSPLTFEQDAARRGHR